ncbi:MAG: sulfurtransferase TusA family protein [Synergistaceae bacterium]|jgi:TusA-related sulfurtransferase|nr:sulfurtransferase TusA family protein [Synergistaceae bacterium]
MNDVITIDTSGLSCPQPVIELKKVLDKTPSGRVEVLVDTATSRNNVARFAGDKGWKTTLEERDGGYKVILEK